MGSQSIYWIWLAPLIGAAFNLLVVPMLRIRSKFVVHTVAICSVAVSFIVALACIFPIPGLSADHATLLDAYNRWREAGSPHDSAPALTRHLWDWITIGSANFKLDFRLDTLSAVMALVVTFVGTLIHIYSTGYMADDERYATYFGYLNLFMGSMLILVLGDSLPVMFIGWEGVGLCSYLLIGFWFQNNDFATAGRKAFVVNRIGDFAFILGMLLLFWALTMDGGSTSLSWKELTSPALAGQGGLYTTPLNALRHSHSWIGADHLAAFAGILLFIGACGKSAQIPLYVWLPDAMAGPTPVSALIHAATMVTAGVYMVARLSALYASSTTAMAVVATIGALTAAAAAFMAFAQTDLKKVLAYSTVSQLGFMFTAVGVGAYSAGIFHLMTHAFFKAGLFLGAGSVMHAMSGSGDITKMGGLRKKLPITHITFLIYCLAISGFPLFSGFFSKDEILAGAFGAKQEGWLVSYGVILWAILVVAAVGTAFYMFRLYFLVFGGDKTRCDAETEAHIHESSSSMTAPLVVLAIGALGLGFLGLPEFSFMHGLIEKVPQLSRWLEPSLVGFTDHHGVWHVGSATRYTELSDGTLSILLVVAITGALAGIGIAWGLYRKGPSAWVERFTAGGLGRKLYLASKNKLWVDEFYNLVIIRPFRWVAMALWSFVDKFVIDLIFVNGAAFVVDVFGRVARWFQNGQVERYIVALLVGGALIFYLASRPSAEMTIHVDNADIAPYVDDILGTAERFEDDQDKEALALRRLLAQKDLHPYRVTLRGNAGEGPGSEGSKLTWYLNGKPLDRHEPEVTIDLGQPGEYDLALEAKDGVFGKSKRISRKLVIPDVVDLAYSLEARQAEEAAR